MDAPVIHFAAGETINRRSSAISSACSFMLQPSNNATYRQPPLG
jgi:hypothetical protein